MKRFPAMKRSSYIVHNKFRCVDCVVALLRCCVVVLVRVVMLQFLEAFVQADWSCMHWLFRSLGVSLAKRELFSHQFLPRYQPSASNTLVGPGNQFVLANNAPQPPSRRYIFRAP